MSVARMSRSSGEVATMDKDASESGDGLQEGVKRRRGRPKGVRRGPGRPKLQRHSVGTARDSSAVWYLVGPDGIFKTVALPGPVYIKIPNRGRGRKQFPFKF